MKKILYTLITVCGLIGFTHQTYGQGQGTNFAMYHYAPTLNNPAMLGNSDEAIVKYGFRNQPLANGQAFTTHLITAGVPIYFGAEKHSRLTLGGSLMLDNQTKFFKTNGVILNAGYTVRLGKHQYLGAGFQGGFSQRGVDLQGTTESQYEELKGAFNNTLPNKESIDGQNKSFSSFDAGLLWTMRDEFGDDRAFLGISAHGFNEPNVSLVSGTSDKLASRLIGIAGVTVYHQNHLSIVPNFRIMQQAANTNLNIGTWIRYGIGDIHAETQRKKGSIGLGLWYNINGALIGSVEWHHPNFFASVAYNASVNNSIQTIQGAGIVELCVGLKLRRKAKVVTEGFGTNP